MRRQRGFGLTLAVADGIELPELPVVDAAEGERLTTLRVDELDAAARSDDGATRTRTLSAGGVDLLWVDQLPDGRYRLTSPGHGVFVVSHDGREVSCAPHAGASRWEDLLAAQILPLASTLAGNEVFHAGGIVVGGGAVLLTAPSGVGKTSLTAHLVGQGAELLADDVVAISLDAAGVPTAHAGGRWLHLWPEEGMRVLAGYPGRVAAQGTRETKQIVEVAGSAAPVPIVAICLLERADDPTVAPITTAGPISSSALLGATFNLSVKTPARLVRQLDTCQALERSATIYHVRVRPGMDAKTLAGVVLERLGEGI